MSRRTNPPPAPDPIELAILKHAFHSVAQEMGVVLRRTASSPNIKERRDYSSAVFDAAGQILAMGDDMPVHLGSMPMSVAAALADLRLGRDDIALLNDPYRGGTHLPDLTLVAPVYLRSVDTAPAFYVANRAHHADVGGAFPGSMGLCREIHQEGVRIPPLKLIRQGAMADDVLRLILANVRTPAERQDDLNAQVGACRVGVRRLRELAARYNAPRLLRNLDGLLQHSERLMRALLAGLPAGCFAAEDALDDDGLGSGPIPLRVAITIEPEAARATVDFSGSAPQVAGSLNAVYAIAYSAVFYVFRCLLPPEAAPTAGLMRPLSVLAPEGTVVNALPPAAVAGGNVETSQRLVDVLLRALAPVLPDRIPAASAGTMNNLTIGGVDPRTGRAFAYYETSGGGMGGLPGFHGLSGVHTHMSNTLNTPVEALEYAYPFRVRRYALRAGSGGEGKWRGGDGLIREIELLAPAQVTLLSDRRLLPPWGLNGGAPGQCGRNSVVEAGQERELPAKCNLHLPAGAILRLETPGGGGWGEPDAPPRRFNRAAATRKTRNPAPGS